MNFTLDELERYGNLTKAHRQRVMRSLRKIEELLAAKSEEPPSVQETAEEVLERIRAEIRRQREANTKP